MLLLFTFLRFLKIATDEFSDIMENVEILDDSLKIGEFISGVTKISMKTKDREAVEI